MATFEIPEELRESKETWFRIFTNKSFIATLVFASVGYLFRLICNAFGLPVLGWIILILFALTGFCLFTIRVPGTSVLGGGRLFLAQKFWRWFLHRGKICAYVPVYGAEEADSECGQKVEEDAEEDAISILT